MLSVYINDPDEPDQIQELEGDFVAVVNSTDAMSSVWIHMEKIGAYHEALPVLLVVKNVYDALRRERPQSAKVYRNAIMKTLTDNEFWDWEEDCHDNDQ